MLSGFLHSVDDICERAKRLDESLQWRSYDGEKLVWVLVSSSTERVLVTVKTDDGSFWYIGTQREYDKHTFSSKEAAFRYAKFQEIRRILSEDLRMYLQ